MILAFSIRSDVHSNASAPESITQNARSDDAECECFAEWRDENVQISSAPDRVLKYCESREDLASFFEEHSLDMVVPLGIA
jgi:hypothetical protein